MKKKLHTTLLALLLVMIPPYFLVFTEEGQRISDNALLWLFGQESLMFNLQQADSSFSSTDIRQAFPDIDWQCGAVNSRFGQTACTARIGSFNDLPAHQAVMYFVHDRLNAVQIRYRTQYHQALLAQLIDTLGEPHNLAQLNDQPSPDDVLEWHTGKGLVVLKKSIQDTDQPALLWLGSTPSTSTHDGNA